MSNVKKQESRGANQDPEEAKRCLVHRRGRLSGPPRLNPEA